MICEGVLYVLEFNSKEVDGKLIVLEEEVLDDDDEEEIDAIRIRKLLLMLSTEDCPDIISLPIKVVY
jgi:hypothetical protein